MTPMNNADYLIRLQHADELDALKAAKKATQKEIESIKKVTEKQVKAAQKAKEKAEDKAEANSLSHYIVQALQERKERKNTKNDGEDK